MSELPYFSLREVCELFGYRNYKTAAKAARNNTFPIPCYKLASNREWVVDRAAAREFFKQKRAAALRAVAESNAPASRSKVLQDGKTRIRTAAD